MRCEKQPHVAFPLVWFVKHCVKLCVPLSGVAGQFQLWLACAQPCRPHSTALLCHLC